MILKAKSGYHIYRLHVGSEDYLFRLDEKGKGKLCFFSEAWRRLGHENPELVELALNGDEKARGRVEHLEGEFSHDVALSAAVTKEFWLVADATLFPDKSPIADFEFRKKSLEKALLLVIANAL